MSEKIFSGFVQNYASLGSRGEINMLEGGDAFWNLPAEKFDEIGQSWLITEFEFTEDWQTWEMHPHGEEVVYLLSGAMDLTLDREGDLQMLQLRGKGLIIIPRNTWHTAKVLEPSKMLVITFGKDTQVKQIEN